MLSWNSSKVPILARLNRLVPRFSVFPIIKFALGSDIANFKCLKAWLSSKGNLTLLNLLLNKLISIGFLCQKISTLDIIFA